MRRNQTWISLVMAGVVLAVMPFQVWAKGPGSEPEQPKYDEETLARLQDSVIEYSEISDLVHEYNPDISEMWKSYGDSKEDYENMIEEMESRYRDVKITVDNYISMGQTTGNEALIMAGKSLDKSYKGTLTGMKESVNKWDTDMKNTSTIRRYERQMISGVQGAMIGYDSIRKNLPTLETMVRLYERQYELAQRQLSLGTGTQADVLKAQKELLAAQSQYTALSTQADSTRRTLQMLLGRDPEEQLDIRAIPDFDINRIAGMNLEEDTIKAIGNNITLINQRHSALGNTTSQIENRMKAVEEGDQKVTIEMERLYQDVMSKKAAYEAAVKGFEAAEAGKGASDRQYQVGYISEVQHIGTQIAYYQKKAALESANLSLLQAMETYDWAILGFATVE